MSIREQFNNYSKEDKAAILLKLPKRLLLVLAQNRGLPESKLKNKRKLNIVNEVLSLDDKFTEDEVITIVEHISGYSPYFTVYVVLGSELRDSLDQTEDIEKPIVPDNINFSEKVIYRKEVSIDVQINKDDVPVLVKREQLVAGIRTAYTVNYKKLKLITIVANNSRFAYSFAEQYVEALETLKPKYKEEPKTNPRPPYPPETIFFFNLVKKLESRIEGVDKVELLNSAHYNIKTAVFSGTPFRDQKFWDFIIERRSAIKGVSFDFAAPVETHGPVYLHINVKFLEYMNLLRIAIANKGRTQNTEVAKWIAVAHILEHVIPIIDSSLYNEISSWIENLGEAIADDDSS